MRKRKGALAAALAAVTLAVPMTTAGAGSSGSGSESTAGAESSLTGELVVSYAAGVDAASARQAIGDAGGTVVDEIAAIGLAKVHTDNAGFRQAVLASGAVDGVARNHSVGLARPGMAHRYAIERDVEGRASREPGDNNAGGVGQSSHKPGPETFSHLQWGLDMVNAPEAHDRATGDGVLVGIIDTGIDASHADLAANVDTGLSRNFTTDKPDIDGPCEAEPDQSCTDPATVDESGHGTHVAGIVGADDNGLGVMGVAPDATLVNLRAGQDSGYFFVFETVAALTYAGDNGIDVANMSFYTDPWLYNCQSKADYISGEVSDEEIAQQAMIRQAVLDAAAYARGNGVTLVNSAGNGAFDLAADQRPDSSSPDYPPDTAHDRVVTDNCLDLPSEAPGAIQVVSLGPSESKSAFSNYGHGEVDVSAPGGWFRDFIGTKDHRQAENMVLSAYPTEVAREEGVITKGGGLTDKEFYERDCTDGKPCAYYTYLQGTSMAAPHVTGVVALIIDAYNDVHGANPTPDQVAAMLEGTASDRPCPPPEDLVYTDEGRPESWNAHCDPAGTAAYNGIYGHGIVDAAAAAAVAGFQP